MGPAARLWRSKLSALSAVVLALVVLSSGLLQTGSAKVLSQVLDQNWRGAYDILVRPAGQDLATASTSGFVEGNFVAVTGKGGISLGQLKAIRQIDGVGVAAPIGLVGQVGNETAAPIVDIPDRPLLHTSALPDHPALYEIGFTVSLTDAGGTRVVDKETIHAILQRQTTDPLSGIMVADNSADGGASPEDGITFSGPALPSFSSSVIAVDPAAEMQLLGTNGEFLEPLTQVPSKRAASALTDSDWIKSIPAPFLVTTELFQSVGTNTDGTESAEAIPLLVNNTPGATLTLNLTAAVADKPVKMVETAHEVRALAAKATYRPLGSSTKDLTSLLVPFETGNLNVPWPGTPGFPIDQYQTGNQPNIVPDLVGRPTYTVTAGPPENPATPSFKVKPRGLVTIDGKSTVDNRTLGGLGAGVQAYRSLVPSSDVGLPTTATLNLPIGSFSLKDLDFGASGISYTPFGAYDPAKTTWLATPDGKPADGRPIVANPSGLDFISPTPGAITDLTGAQALRGDTPIDAIRVRVAGITGYTPANQQKVIAVADRIAALGLSVSVVAGSSPQPVDIYVPQYKVAASGATSDLGWVRQDWTTLGAAVQVQNTLRGLSVLLLVVALLVAAVLYVGVAAADRPRRIAQAEALATLGWTRRRIARWMVSPSLLVLAFLVVVGVGAGTLTRFSAPTVLAALAALVIAAVGVLVVGATSGPPTDRIRKWRPPRWADVGSAFAVGMRQVLTRPAATAVRALSWVVVSVSVPLILVAVTDAHLRAGATRLAGFALDRTSVADLSLGALTLVAGLLLIAVARRVESRERAGQNRTLAGLGWTARELRRRDLADTAVTTAVAAAPVVIAVLILGGRSLGLGAPLAVLAAAVTLLLCAALSVSYRPIRSRP